MSAPESDTTRSSKSNTTGDNFLALKQCQNVATVVALFSFYPIHYCTWYEQTLNLNSIRVLLKEMNKIKKLKIKK